MGTSSWVLSRSVLGWEGVELLGWLLWDSVPPAGANVLSRAPRQKPPWSIWGALG